MITSHIENNIWYKTYNFFGDKNIFLHISQHGGERDREIIFIKLRKISNRTKYNDVRDIFINISPTLRIFGHIKRKKINLMN